MRLAHLLVVVVIFAIPFLPVHIIIRYNLYLMYVGLAVLWLALGKCPMGQTHDTPEEIVKYRPTFLHKLLRMLFTDMSLNTFLNIFIFGLVALLTIATLRIVSEYSRMVERKT